MKYPLLFFVFISYNSFTLIVNNVNGSYIEYVNEENCNIYGDTTLNPIEQHLFIGDTTFMYYYKTNNPNEANIAWGKVIKKSDTIELMTMSMQESNYDFLYDQLEWKINDTILPSNTLIRNVHQFNVKLIKINESLLVINSDCKSNNFKVKMH